MIVKNVISFKSHSVFITEDGLSIPVRPKLPQLNAFFNEISMSMIGNTLHLVDYTFMESNWEYVNLKYNLIKKFDIDGFKPPVSYNDFNELLYDVYKGVKPYAIYLTKEYSISNQRSVTWFYKSGKRAFIDFTKEQIKIAKEFDDII